MPEVKKATIIAIYDISGIQSYIFATNKLKEAVGASQIVHDILYQTLPEKLGDTQISNRRSVSNYPALEIDEDKKGNIIYIGGGNAVVVYPDRTTMQKVTRTLQEKLFELTRGQLRLCYGCTSINDYDNYSAIDSKLREELANYKATTPPILPVRGFSIGSDDNETNDSNQLFYIDSKMYVGSYARGQKVRTMLENKNKEMEQKKENQKQYLEADGFETYREEGDKSFVGVIHIDGNTMGQHIQSFVSNINGELKEQLLAMRKLANEINQLYQNVLDETIREVFKKEIATSNKTLLPVRTIIADGDDITVVIKANRALLFTKVFLEKLKESSKTLESNKFPLSAGAGIALVHDKFPFSVAYDIAEQLCKNAKKRGRAYASTNTPPSSVDFQVIFSGITTNIQYYRDKNYIIRGTNEPYSLIKRPYLLLDDTKNKLSIDKFINDLNEIQNSSIASSKLEALRHAYAESENATIYTFNQIMSRQTSDNSFYLTEAFEKLLGINYFDNSDEIKETESTTKVATYFDLLDMMNFYSGGEDTCCDIH